MKVLNLDQLVESKAARVIKMFGKEHNVPDMTVENYVETTLAAEKLDTEATSGVSHIEATIAMICRSIPTLAVENVKKLSLEQMQALVRFVRGEDEDAEKQAAQGAQQAAGK